VGGFGSTLPKSSSSAAAPGFTKSMMKKRGSNGERAMEQSLPGACERCGRQEKLGR
jgi:hypothetical protein